jgi:carboxypeptidase Q
LPPTNIKIDEYRAAAARIIGAALTSNRAYSRLAHLTDHIGHRLSGSQALERGIKWAVAEMKKDGFDNVRTEKVMVPH